MHIWTEAMPEAIEERKWRSIYVITLCDQLNTGRKVMKQTDQITKYVCVCVCVPHIYIFGALLCAKHCSYSFAYLDCFCPPRNS